jgi:hypothetical protein
MAVTVSGTSITFNDATVQTTAATALTTATVLSATAGASVGAVGTYAWLQGPGSTTVSPGSTVAGSSLNYSASYSSDYDLGTASAYTAITGSTVSGTWRCMGNRNGDTSSTARLSTLWLRIS